MRNLKFASLCLALTFGAGMSFAQTSTSADQATANKDKSTENWKTNQNADQKITNGPVIEYVSDHSATIAWSTKKAGGTYVAYGTDRNNLSKKETASWGGTNHRQELRNLQPGTTYYFQVRSNDAKGSGADVQSEIASFTTKNKGEQADRTNRNVGVNGDQSASASTGSTTSTSTALPQSDQPSTASTANVTREQASALRLTSGPNVEMLGDTAATISFTTNNPGNAYIMYGTTPTMLNQRAASLNNGSTQHRVQLTGLQPNTQYYVQIRSDYSGGYVDLLQVVGLKTKTAGAQPDTSMRNLSVNPTP